MRAAPAHAGRCAAALLPPARARLLGLVADTTARTVLSCPPVVSWLRFVVKPVRKAWHRIRPAKMFFVDGADGEATITHLSNTLPDLNIAESADSFEEVRSGQTLALADVRQPRRGGG